MTTYATPPADWLDTYDGTSPIRCVHCGGELCSNFEKVRGLWGHTETMDTVCRPQLPSGDPDVDPSVRDWHAAQAEAERRPAAEQPILLVPNGFLLLPIEQPPTGSDQ